MTTSRPLKSAVCGVVASKAKRLEVRPVKPALPALLGLDRRNVVNLGSNSTALLAKPSCILQLRLRQPLPLGRRIEAGVLRVSLSVVVCVAFLLAYAQLLFPFLLGERLAGETPRVRVWHELPTARACLKEQSRLPFDRSSRAVCQASSSPSAFRSAWEQEQLATMPQPLRGDSA